MGVLKGMLLLFSKWWQLEEGALFLLAVEHFRKVPLHCIGSFMGKTTSYTYSHYFHGFSVKVAT